MRHDIAGRNKIAAIHESAHACLSVSCGHGVKRVIIAPHPALHPGEGGRVDYYDYQHEADVDPHGLALAALVAGAAERRHTGRHDALHESGDREQALHLCALMLQDAPTAPKVLTHLETLVTLADGLVYREWLWSRIVAVANKLMTSRVPLTGRDVQVIGEQVSRRKESA